MPDSCEDASALQLTRNHQVPSFPGLGPGGNPHPAMTVTNVVFDGGNKGTGNLKWVFAVSFGLTFAMKKMRKLPVKHVHSFAQV